MAEDQGLAIVPWAALGGGTLLTKDQRKQRESDPEARRTSPDEKSLHVSEVLEHLAAKYNSTLQAVVRIAR